MSHGIPRVSQNEPRAAGAAEKEQRDIERYISAVQAVEQKIAKQDHGSETLLQITQLLRKNPEYYTIWNHRRRVMMSAISTKSDLSDVAKELEADLKFLVPIMMKFPKCYWIWNYRLWLLEQATNLLPTGSARNIWQGELNLVGQMLSRDGRNFHGWGYRRTVVTALESQALKVDDEAHSLVKAELDYTATMINTDLSNFSAWHNRSRLIPRLLDERGAGDEERKAMLDEELELIHEALIDPYDQSLWFYHACITWAFSPSQADKSIAPALSDQQRLGYLVTESEFVLEMLDETIDCKWIYQSLIQLTADYLSLGGSWPQKASRENVGFWMEELKKLDPLRHGRWTEWEERLNL